ncbi:MAG TPA: carboxypeptidase-like regulatory domain-containing protein, partial [Pyrinomonadaceae bacterium]
FSNNNLSGNWYAQVVDRQTGGSLPAPNTTNLKNFRGNWWGTASPVVTTANSAEPGYAAQIPVAYGGTATAPGGQPDIAGAASANIKYMPLLTNGGDTNIETTPGRGTFGFQGARSVVSVKPSMSNGWSAVSQRTASGSFVNGPGMPPLGSGSYRMMLGAGNSGPDLPQGGAGQGGKTWLTTQQFDNTLLSGISVLGYSTYVAASPSSAGNIITPTLQLQIDLDGNGTRDSTMIFEPYYSTAAGGGTQSNVALGQWQTWDARAGKWWFNNATVFGCGQCAFPTFDAIIAAYPNAKIVTWYALADGYGTQLVAGQNSAGSPWANFDGNIDAFTITVNAPNTTFDFEPLAPTAASVSIAGQVLTATGQSIPNAKIFLTDNQGVKRVAVSNAFGHYGFEGITVGETYILSVVSKRYTFTPRAVEVNEELTALNLIAEL